MQIELTASMLRALADALGEGEVVSSLYLDRNDGYEAVILNTQSRLRYVRWDGATWVATS